MAVTFFAVPFNGSFLGFTLSALIYVTATTALGFLVSVFIASQVAALFATAMLTMIPAVSYSEFDLPGLSSLFGFGRVPGRDLPLDLVYHRRAGLSPRPSEWRNWPGRCWPWASPFR